jgi:hypothetical protein
MIQSRGERSVYVRLALLAVMFAVGATSDGCNCRGGAGDHDDPPSPGALQFSQATLTVSEYAGQIQIPVDRVNGTLGAVSVQVTVGAASTATGGGTDYAGPTPTTLNWADGSNTPQIVTITITDDLLADNNETIVLTLTTPTGGAVLGNATITITLVETWTKYPSNPVLAGSVGQWNAGGVLSPCVLRLPGATNLTMYYNGFETTDNFGLTTSTDGVTWQNPGTVVFPLGAAGKFDEGTLWDPSVVYDATLTPPYHMWYTGTRNVTVGMTTVTEWRIGYATSTNGTSWNRQNNGDAVLTPTAGGWDDIDVYWCHVIRDAGVWKMWYTGYGGTLGEAIGYAESADGISWTKMGPTVGSFTPGPVLEATGTGFETASVITPCVIKDGSTYRMWYAGWLGGTVLNTEIGYATSPNGTTWTRYAGNPVVTRGAAGTWEETGAWFPHVLREGSAFRMWYTGTQGTGTGMQWRIGYASNP